MVLVAFSFVSFSLSTLPFTFPHSFAPALDFVCLFLPPFLFLLLFGLGWVELAEEGRGTRRESGKEAGGLVFGSRDSTRAFFSVKQRSERQRARVVDREKAKEEARKTEVESKMK